MLKQLLNFQVVKQLGSSMHADVYLARPKAEPNGSVVLKKIKRPFCNQDLAEYLHQQLEQLTELAIDAMPLPTLLTPGSDMLCLQWADAVECRSLDTWLAQSPDQSLSIADALNIAIAVAEQLERRHKAGHIHKSVKPSNILIHHDTFAAQLIDDIRVLDINQISHFIYNDYFRRHTLPYLSPEQTGRIRQNVNYSTDLYSLGMVLFECLTGKPPFLFADPVTIIHSHLAETPPTANSLNSEIPETLANIVAVLLEKAPEKRYQTASGLAFDLKNCQARWQAYRHMPAFTLQQRDFSNRITIPSLMVGRDAEKKQLLAEHAKSCAGVFRAVLISGFSGIGKTRLIQELQLPIVAHAGYFTSGKFDQFKKHIPYSTLIQALSNLIKTFLTEDQQRIHYWQQRIGQQVGEHGKLLTDLLPDLELIIGKQPEVADLPPIEARNRFNDVVGKLIACLASREHPLTLFIDDLQWCDGATFDLLERLFDNAGEYPYLYWLGAYRHNEVDESHRLTRLIAKVKAGHKPLLEIKLRALGPADVNQMTAYILNTYPSRTHGLAEIIFQTSAGNPLFVNESLRWLHSYRHLHLGDNGVWAWDDEQLRHTAIPQSALELFKDKIAKLDERSRSLLGIAACLGARFAAADLACAVALPLPELYRALAECFAHNVLLREKDQIVFFHDQVQAAAESFLNTERKQAIHRQIAAAFIARIPPGTALENVANLFTIVEHLAEGRADQTSASARRLEAEFNYHAGVMAMKALAMDNANFFFRQSRQLFPDSSWDADYDFLFALHKYLARTEMALGNQPSSERILDILIDHARSDLDRIDCLYEQTTGLSSMGKFRQAIELGNRGLRYFGREIPEDDELALQRSAAILAQIHQPNTNGKQPDVWHQILDMTPSGDRATQIETGIYSELIPDYYLAGMVPQLYLSAIQSTQNCLAGGVDETVIYGFSMVGLYLQRQNRYEMSFRYEDLGLALAERYPDTFGATKGINGILWTNMHNRQASAHIIEQCQQNIHRGKNCGDLYNAGLSYGPYIWHLIHQGSHLRQVLTVADECIRFSEKFNLSLSLGLAQSAVAGWSDAMTTGRNSFSSEQIAEKLRQWEHDKHVVSIGGYYTLKGISCHYLGDFDRAAHWLASAQPYLRGLSDNILNRLWYVFRYANGLRNKTNEADETAFLQHCREQVARWAELGPILKPYLAFMRMEEAFVVGDFSDTRRYCLDALDSARQARYVLLEAYLHERLGQLYWAVQHEQAAIHLHQAAEGYRACGAEVKARQLTEQFSLTLVETADQHEQSLAQRLDVNYLLQATQAITRQLGFNELLSTILQAVMARLGAKTGYVLIVENQNLALVATGEKQDQVEVRIGRQPETAIENLSMAIAHYVYRTSEMCLLDNACNEGPFVADATVRRRQLRSVLCMPLLIQQKVLGVLYLENNLIPAVFTAEQVELTRLLTAQAAIALQNTQLIDAMQRSRQTIETLNKELEQRVQQRTLELNKVNEELKHFAYVVSHDLKAPLRAINQLSKWIAEDYAAAFDDAGREQMALLQSRARRMHEMIDGILQYSRIGRVKDEAEEVDVAALINDAIQLISPPDNFEFDVRLPLPTVKAERLRLHQVFQNLLDNAVKYNDKTHGRIAVACVELAEYWEFSVTDNGPGIDRKYHEKVFQLFQTLKPKDQSGSSGIGLGLIQKIVGHWGGSIRLHSEAGRGCTFFFTLPKTIINHE